MKNQDDRYSNMCGKTLAILFKFKSIYKNKKCVYNIFNLLEIN